LNHMPQVVAVMTPFPFSIQITASLLEAEQLMKARNFRHLPVMADGRLSGVLSERDVRSALLAHRKRADASELRVSDAYREDAYVVEASMPLDQVAAAMSERHIGSAIVIKDGKLVGIFTSTDACRALARVLRERFPPPSPGTAAA